MFQEAVREFAADEVRPAALDADADRETPPELLAQVNELGVNMLGVPEELGGVMQRAGRRHRGADRRGARPRRHGHRLRGARAGRASPPRSATGAAPSRRRPTCPPSPARTCPWPPLAILEPRPLFDPLKLETKARRDGADWVIDGVKSLVARAKECELFVVAAETEENGPALFVIESGASGLSVEDEPAMGAARGRDRAPRARGRTRPRGAP